MYRLWIIAIKLVWKPYALVYEMHTLAKLHFRACSAGACEVKHKAWFTHLMYVFTSTFSCNSAKKDSRHGLTLNKTSLWSLCGARYPIICILSLSIRLYCEFNSIMFPRCAQVTSKWPLHHIFSRFTNLIAASCSAIAHSLYHLEFVALWSVSSVHVVS